MFKLFFILVAVLFSSNLWAIDVYILTSIQGNLNPTVVGNTNLPDNTSLIVTIDGQQDLYRAQSKVKVSYGKFNAGPFTKKGAPLNPGVYNLNISTPIASVQPPEVRMVIGDKGINLKGIHIKSVPFSGKVVKFQKEIRIEDSTPLSDINQSESKRTLQPLAIVKGSPCKQGGTIQRCLNQKLNAPAVQDLGWSFRNESGRYIVEKIVHVKGLQSPTIYRWSVSMDGTVSPENGHALSLSAR